MKLAELNPRLYVRNGAMLDYEETDDIQQADALAIWCPFCATMGRKHSLHLWSASGWKLRGTMADDLSVVSLLPPQRAVEWHTQCGTFSINRGKVYF